MLTPFKGFVNNGFKELAQEVCNKDSSGKLELKIVKLKRHPKTHRLMVDHIRPIFQHLFSRR
jgi:hypothetical protein